MRVNEGGSDRRPLHLIQDLANLLEVGDVRSVGVQGAFTRGTLGKRGDEELEGTAGMDLEVQSSSNGVLPQLSMVEFKSRYTQR